MQAFDIVVVVNQVENRGGDPGHDAHACHNVLGVGQLDAVLRNGSADRAHAEWYHVHGATWCRNK